MIELKHVQKSFDDVTPLTDVNVVINDGDVISVIGPSGCGKSTLLRCINLLDPPTGGQIFVDGEDITAPGYDRTRANRKIGMVFQRWNLFGHWTILENAMLPQMRLLGRSKQEAYDKASRLLCRVGLSEKMLSYPDELSGGQQQRAAIARTLAMDPEIVLFDEPTSALDPGNVGEVEEVISGLARAGCTMVIVTHEMRFARRVANRVFYMDEGGIYEDGTPDQIFDNPQREKTQWFIRKRSLLEIDVAVHDFDFPAMVARIDEYAARHRLSFDLTRRIQTVAEELSVSIIMPRLPQEGPRMRVIGDYSEKQGSLTFAIMYNGPLFDPSTTDNAYALMLAQGAAKDMRHESIDHEGFTNKVTVTLA